MKWVADAVHQTQWLGKAWRFYERVASTQDEAKAWVQRGAPHGALVVADAQTQGRGRWGRSWFSPPQTNLYLTVAVRLPSHHPPLGTLSLLVGVAVAEALRRRFAVPAEVKWANDVVVGGKKLAGVLVERFTAWALIGLGLNVNLPPDAFPEELKMTATSVQAVSGKPVDRSEALAAILVGLEAWWDRWARDDIDPLWSAFAALDFLRGKEVQVVLPDGSTVKGSADGVASDGALRLRLTDGTVRLFVAGDVTVRLTAICPAAP